MALSQRPRHRRQPSITLTHCLPNSKGQYLVAASPPWGHHTPPPANGDGSGEHKDNSPHTDRACIKPGQVGASHDPSAKRRDRGARESRKYDHRGLRPQRTPKGG